jgi:FAD:protein FMN transferase
MLAALGSMWDPRYEATITLQLTEGGPRAERPFVAIWIEKRSGAEIPTVGVWLHQTRGEQYTDEVRRRYRAYRARRDATRVDLLRTVSSATRHAGTHTVTWDGRDNAGKPVERGACFVCIEAAREHGGYTLLRN